MREVQKRTGQKHGREGEGREVERKKIEDMGEVIHGGNGQRTKEGRLTIEGVHRGNIVIGQTRARKKGTHSGFFRDKGEVGDGNSGNDQEGGIFDEERRGCPRGEGVLNEREVQAESQRRTT